MRILIIRHADPDYAIDSLTKKGWREAEHLSERLIKEDIKAFYVSSLGRARDTAMCTLKRLGRSQDGVFEWLKEFPSVINRPDRKCSIAWDWLPQDWTTEERFYDRNEWANVDVMKEGRVKEEYERVTGEFDKLLEKHGYVRDGRLYRVEKGNNDTIAIFCHFGSACVLLSHLLNVSPMVMWHGFCAPPSSVTTVISEERRKGKAVFRINGFGDVSHLYAKGEESAFAARFCEMYENEDERHD